MHYIPNPLLTLLLRPEQKTIITWRFTLALVGLVTCGGAVALLAVMLSTDDYYVRERYQDYFGWGYLSYIGLSVLMPLLTTVYGAILTSAWTSRDEKFDLLRLTPLHERAYAESYFVAVLHRVRLLLGLQTVFGLLTPLLLLVIVYWEDHPAPVSYSGYPPYSDYQDYTPITTYVAVYGLLLLYNIALGGLSFIGSILGVRFGIYARHTTNAITLSVGSTCGSLLGLAALAGCLTYGTTAVLLNGMDDIGSEIAAFVFGYTCVATVCVLPVFAMLSWYIGLTQRTVRRD